jgi:tellurite resistance protein TehA-like permease
LVWFVHSDSPFLGKRKLLLAYQGFERGVSNFYGLPGNLHQNELLFFALSMWFCGGMLYIWLISLIFYRYTFFRFLPSDLMPSYWINMGAMAISTLAGTLLIERASEADFLAYMLPFLRGFTLFCWATATWWIPM